MAVDEPLRTASARVGGVMFGHPDGFWRANPAEAGEFEDARDRLSKAETPTALTLIGVIVLGLSIANILLLPDDYPWFRAFDFGSALVLLLAASWLRRPSVPASFAPWVFVGCMLLLALVLLTEARLDTRIGPVYVLIVLGLTGPLTLAWRPFLVGSVAMTAAVAVATRDYPANEVIDWTIYAISATAASAVLLHLRQLSIGDAVHASHELAEQTRRMELVLESSRLGLWDWNMLTDELVVDERWAQIVGYRLEELAPVTIRTKERLTHPDDLAAADAAREEHVAGALPFHEFDVRMRHHDGSWVWVRDRGRIVAWSPDGRPLRMTGTHEDVSRAHRDAELLATANEESRLAMERSAIGLCMASTDGRFVRVNPAMCRMLERTEAELVGMSMTDVTHPDDVAASVDALRALVSGDDPSFRMLKRYVAPDGRVIWGEATISTIRDDDGAVRHLIAQVIDVTERVTAAADRAASEEMLRVVLDHTSDIIMRFGPDLRAEYANQRLVDLTGMSHEEWQGKTFLEAGYPPELAASWDEYSRQVFATGEPVLPPVRARPPRGPSLVRDAGRPRVRRRRIGGPRHHDQPRRHRSAAC